MRIASIDIGTNTNLLLVADVDEGGNLHTLAHEQRFPRIGRNVDQSKIIHPSNFEQIVLILEQYKSTSQRYHVAHLIAAATSAVRDAVNKEDFLAYVKNKTGIDIEVLDGKEEALWSYRGAISGTPHPFQPVVVLDIGGGSTEVSIPSATIKKKQRTVDIHQFSYQIGCVRITEQYFGHNPPTAHEIHLAEKTIVDQFNGIPEQDLSTYQLLGVAGTVTTLACLDQKLTDFKVDKVRDYVLKLETVNSLFEMLCTMTAQEIQSLSNATIGREDILTAGALILNIFMQKFHFDSITVSERGLRYGLVVREWERNRSLFTQPHDHQ